MTYTWKVTGMKVKDQVNEDGVTLSNVVVQTYWTKTLTTEDGRSATFDGALPFTAETVSEGEFVSFENLTEETVLSWIQEALVPGVEEEINKRLQEILDKAEQREVALPWS